jgi:excisionase family DNA binding protein
MSTIYLDRVTASQLLKVSTRTLDRYLRKYRIKTKKKGRKILIRRSDVDTIIDDHIGHFIDDFNRLKIAPEANAGNEDTVSAIGRQSVHKNSNLAVKNIEVKDVKAKEMKAEEVYKELFLELKKEVKEKQDRLEAATYRVGQLESQIGNMVPMLDYTKKEKEMDVSFTRRSVTGGGTDFVFNVGIWLNSFLTLVSVNKCVI